MPPAEPTVAEQRASAAALGSDLRAALVALAATDVAPEELDRAAGLARQITGILARRQRPLTMLAPTDDMAAGIRYFSPTTGLGNPMSPPIEVAATDSGVVTRVALDRRFEGPPGFVHGGIIGLLLDEVLGQAATAIGRWGMTAYLNITYRRALPIDVELEFVAQVGATEGRKTTVTGIIGLASDPSTAYVTAEALFIEPRQSTNAGYFADLVDAAGNPTSARFGS